MSRLAVVAALLVLNGLVTAAWAVRVEGSARGGKTIRFAYVGPPDDARNLSALRLKERIERESGGTLAVRLFPGGQLGGDRDAIEGVRLGTIEMTVAGAGIFANFEPAFGVTALPYLVEDFDEAWALCDGPVGEAISRRLVDQGMRVIAHWENGFRCVTNSVRPIERPEDLRSLSIRTPENPILLATLEALGARPSPLPWGELYMALQQGAFDGQENPVPIIFVNKVHEVQPFLAVTNHAYEPMPVVINETFWSGLTAGERRIIAEAVRESQAFNRELVRRRTDEMLQSLRDAGMTITFPDLGEFERATAGVAAEFAPSIGRDLVAEATAFVREHRRRARPQAERGTR